MVPDLILFVNQNNLSVVTDWLRKKVLLIINYKVNTYVPDVISFGGKKNPLLLRNFEIPVLLKSHMILS